MLERDRDDDRGGVEQRVERGAVALALDEDLCRPARSVEADGDGVGVAVEVDLARLGAAAVWKIDSTDADRSLLLPAHHLTCEDRDRAMFEAGWQTDIS